VRIDSLREIIVVRTPEAPMLAHLRSFSRSLRIFGLLAATLAAALGCGDGSSTTVVSNSSTGSVVVVVTDAATEDFLQIRVTVTKVELLGAKGHFTLYEGSRTFDLLAMRDDARLLSLGHEVPAGDWSKIRLQVSDVELIRLVPEGEAGTVVDCPDDVTPDAGFVCESIAPKLGGNGKIDLNPRGPITVRGGELVFVQLDLDANKSIHIVETGSARFVFRPVVFVDLFSVRIDRLVRLEGTIREIDDAAKTLLLCDTHRVFRADAQQDVGPRSKCVDVRIGSDTSIFDDEGDPAVQGDLDVGDPIAALGRFRIGDGESLVFDAEWIQQGGFAAGIAVTGEVVAGVSGDELVIAPDPDGPVASDTLTVRLLSGAKLFDRAGDPVDPGDLVPGVRVRVFGVLAGGSPERLDASLVFVREPADATQLHGTITQRFDASDGTIVIQAATGMSVGPVCVAIGSGDGVFRVTDGGDELLSERIAASDLALGEVVDVFGHPAAPCFDADTVISSGVGGS
jgi:hypothetical protein